MAGLKHESPGKGSGRRPGDRWRLQDAKARFSEVVRRARAEGPQRVTVHGQDAVMIVAARTYDQEHGGRTGRHLVEALAGSPLGEVELDRPTVSGPVRAVELGEASSSTPTSSPNCARRAATRVLSLSSRRSRRRHSSSRR